MDQAAVARHRLEAMEVWTRSLCRAATLRRRPDSGGTNRRQPAWPLAAREQSSAGYRHANRILQITRLSFRRGLVARLIRRTARYGPVCPVVWEGRSRKTAPYPDYCGPSPATASAARLEQTVRPASGQGEHNGYHKCQRRPEQ